MGAVTQIKIHVDGVILTELRQISDERGAVLHMLRSDDPDFTRFGECYCSEVVPGAIKAWKRHSIQAQNLAVPVGRIHFVIYDDRSHSSTRGVVQVVELGRPDAYFRLHIPSGLWYGFTCVSENPALLVNCADLPHDPKESEMLPINNAIVSYQWPLVNK